MKLKDLRTIKETLVYFGDFVETNTDGDRSGIGDEMALMYNKSIELIQIETNRIYLRNAMAKIKRDET